MIEKLLGSCPVRLPLHRLFSLGLIAALGITPVLAGPTKAPLTQKKSTMITTPSGLQYEELVVGTGPLPQVGQTVSVHYTGTLTDGKKFDSSYDRNDPIKFPVGTGRVIKGWDEGLLTMKVGGKRKLIIPPQLGYGDRGAGGVIPGGATLVFIVELLSAK